MKCLARLGAAWLGLLVLAGCGAETEDDDCPTANLGASPDPGGSIRLPASKGTFETQHDVRVSAQGSGAIGKVDIQHGSGSLELDGQTLPTIYYTRAAGFESGQELLLLLSGDSKRWILSWVYCTKNRVDSIWWESTGPVDGKNGVFADVIGSCGEVEQDTNVEADLPALDMPFPKVVSSFRLDGDDVRIDTGTRDAALVGCQPYDIYPFNIVDCTHDKCGDKVGWTELHTVFWSEPRTEACFGIYYLVPGRDSTQLAYFFCLPKFDSPFDSAFYDVSWEANP